MECPNCQKTFGQPLSEEPCSPNSLQEWSRGSDRCPCGQWWLWIVLSLPLLCFHVELDVLGSLFCIAILMKMQQNRFRFRKERQQKKKNKTKQQTKKNGKANPPQPILAFTMWVWSVCPEHGANTRARSSAPLSPAAAVGQAVPAGSFFCFCYGLNLVESLA